MLDRFMPRYSLPSKSYPVLNRKKLFFSICYNRISTKMGLRRLNWVVKQGMQHRFEQQKSSNWVIYRQKSFAMKRGSCNKPIRKLTTYTKDLNFLRTCRRLVDVRDIIRYCSNSSWKWIFRHLLQTFVIVFLHHFLPVLYTVMNYPNTWFTRSVLAWSAHKSNKIYNKIQKKLISITHIFRSATSKTVSPIKCGVA